MQNYGEVSRDCASASTVATPLTTSTPHVAKAMDDVLAELTRLGATVVPVTKANPFDEETDESWAENVRNDAHTQPFNVSGSPTLSVRCGFSRDGLPLSVQFVGRRLSESALCGIGHAYERATQWHVKHPAGEPGRAAGR